MEKLVLPVRLGKEKPVVARELDMLSTPESDDEVVRHRLRGTMKEVREIRQREGW